MTTKFRVETVMTTSIHLRIGTFESEAELPNGCYYTINTRKKQPLFEKKFQKIEILVVCLLKRLDKS